MEKIEISKSLFEKLKSSAVEYDYDYMCHHCSVCDKTTFNDEDDIHEKDCELLNTPQTTKTLSLKTLVLVIPFIMASGAFFFALGAGFI